MPTGTEIALGSVDQESEPGQVEVEPVAEQVEAEPLRESAETVAQLMAGWKDEFENPETPSDRKQEVAYRYVKLGEAITLSGLKAGEVKIREAEPGVLGFYVPSSGEVAMTLAGLELPPEHFRDVLVHEATRAGVTTDKPISDEGLTQIVTRQRVHGAMHGIYESEQRQAHQAFDATGLDRILEAYDFERPQELITLYLKTEWSDAWRDRWQKEIGHQAELQTKDGRQEVMDGPLKEWFERMEKVLEEAAPRLMAKAKDIGFDFAEASEQTLAELVETETKG